MKRIVCIGEWVMAKLKIKNNILKVLINTRSKEHKWRHYWTPFTGDRNLDHLPPGSVLNPHILRRTDSKDSSTSSMSSVPYHGKEELRQTLSVPASAFHVIIKLRSHNLVRIWLEFGRILQILVKNNQMVDHFWSNSTKIDIISYS